MSSWQEELGLEAEASDDAAVGALVVEREDGRIVSARITAGWDNEGVDADEVLAALLEHEDASGLEKLVLGPWSTETYDYSGAVRSIAAAELPALTELVIGDYQRIDDMEISWVNVGNVARLLGSSLPALRRLHVQGGGVELARAAHATLEELSIETGGLAPTAVRGVAAGRFPRLRTLTLWTGDPNYGGESSIDDLEGFFDSDGYPALVELRLENCAYADAIAERLVRSPWCERLTKLSFSFGTMTDAGGAALVEAAARFTKLERLLLRDNFLSDEMVAKLSGAFGESVVEAGEQDVGDEYDGETHYYVSVGE